MNIAGLVAVSGKPGLYKLVGQNKSGFILESLDEQKSKLVVNMSTSKLASLEDITIYGDDEDIRLKEVFEIIKAYEGNIPGAKSDPKVLRAFFTEIVPNHDTERVYNSDIKKIISWFAIIKQTPLFDEVAEEAQADEVEEPVQEEEVKETAATKKPKAAKKPVAKKAAAKKD